MRAHFIHAADLHLGYEQYNLPARADDFARAYMHVAEYAVEAAADFVLLAGDLFHRATADAWMLTQATAGLDVLRDAQIPVVAVEGNHDAQHARKHLSWMQYLNDQGLLTLLNVHIAANGYKSLVPWKQDTGRGSYIDLAGCRIYGIKYYGALTSRILEEIGGQIEAGPGGYTILLLHAGIEGQVPHMHGGLTTGDLNPLHPPVDYLALGHVHKRLELDGWIFNPGSTETNSTEEIEWPHGFFDVCVDTEAESRHTVSAVPTSGARPFRRISINADDAGSFESFIDVVEERIAAERGVPENAVLELHLGGVAAFRRQDLPIERFKSAAEIRFKPLAVRVRNSLVPPGLVQVRHGERLRRSDLEREVVEKLVYQNAEYRDRAAAWTRLILDIKNMAAEKTLPAAIVDHVMGHGPWAMGHGHGATGEQVDDRKETTAAEEAPRPVAQGPLPTARGPLPTARGPLPMAECPSPPEGGEPPCMAPMFEDW